MKQHTFYGSVTVGEKGQIVVPAEARQSLKLKKGEKLMVFGVDDETFCVMKPSKLDAYTKALAEKMAALNAIRDTSN